MPEHEPAQPCGGLNIGFQLMFTIGILAADLVNYGSDKIKDGWGWRLNLALAAVLTVIMFTLLTPHPKPPRGQAKRTKSMLLCMQGIDDVGEEFQGLVEVSGTSKQLRHSRRNIFLKYKR